MIWNESQSIIRTHILLVDQQVALVDVADDDARRVQRVERGGRVAGGQHQMVPADLRKMPAAIRRAVQLVQLAGRRPSW